MKQEKKNKVFHLTIVFPEVEHFDWNPKQSNVIAQQLFLKHYVLWAYKKNPISEEQWHAAPEPCQGLGEEEHFDRHRKSKGIFIALSFAKLKPEKRDALLFSMSTALDKAPGILHSNLTYQTLADELTASEPDNFFVINPRINEINALLQFKPEERKHSLPKPSNDETQFYSNLNEFALTFDRLLTERKQIKHSMKNNGKNDTRPTTPQPTNNKELTTLSWLTKLLKKFMKKCYRLVAQFLGKKKYDRYKPADRQKLTELVEQLRTIYDQELKPKGFIDLVKELHCIKKDKKSKTNDQSSIKADTHKQLAKIALQNIDDLESGRFIFEALTKFIDYENSRQNDSERIETDCSVYKAYSYCVLESQTPAPTPKRNPLDDPPHSPPPLRLIRGMPPKPFNSFEKKLKDQEEKSSDAAPTLRLGEWAR